MPSSSFTADDLYVLGFLVNILEVYDDNSDSVQLILRTILIPIIFAVEPESDHI